MKKLLISALFLATLSFPSLALAGGGPVYFNVEPNSPLYPGKQYIVHAQVSADGPYPTYCENCFINLKFRNPQGSDYIAQNSDKTDNDGRIYAKVISKVSGPRVIYAEIKKEDGTLVHSNSEVTLNYVESTGVEFIPSQESESTTPPTGNFYAKLGTQKYIDGPKRQVYVSWGNANNAVKYNLYVHTSDMSSYESALVSTGDLSTEIGLNAFLDFYLRVDACNTNGCISSNEIFIPKMEKSGDSTISESLTSTTNIESSNPQTDVKKLNEKVENLEKKLEESNKKQSFLEQRINDLVNFIKSIFPAFN